MAQRVHLPSLREIPGVRVIAICDLIEERAAALASEFSIPAVYTIYHRMLADEKLDALFVLVEPGSLFHVTRNALAAGLHVFMEKPPGIDTYQASSLARAAREAGKILQVGFNRRYIPLVRRAIDMVRDRGPITQVDGRFMKDGSGAFDAGALTAFDSDTIHCVDLVRWMAGGEATHVASVVAGYEEPFVNAWNAVMLFDTGVTGTVRANYRVGGRIHSFEVHAPGATALIDLGLGSFGCRATLMLSRGGQGYSLSARGQGKVEVVELDGMELAGSEAFHRYYGFFQEDEDFVRCVREGASPLASIEDAARSMELAHTIQRKAINLP
jgi:predicted dehydrogenase